ncbi:hypothetical protein K458DRAFT_270673, partial [Lentithecium fluviatile CBS 122367]
HTRRERRMNLNGAASRTAVMERSRVLVARSTCTNDSDPGCTKPTVVPKLPIILAVVLPILAAVIVLFFLHRRNQKKLREEDANDKYRSLDFGVDPATGSKRARAAPEMALADTEKTVRGGHDKQLSLDMDVANPYILPAALHGSRESFHSLSRNGDSHDPYRPVTFIKDSMSVRSGSRSDSRTYRHDNGSMYTTSSGGTERRGMNDGLLKNAQRMSQSFPLAIIPPEKDAADLKYPEPIAVPLSPLNPRSQADPLPPPPPPPPGPVASEPEQPRGAYTPYSPSVPAPPAAVPSPDPSLPPVQEAKVPTKSTPSPPPRIQSQAAVLQMNANTASFISTSSYGDGFQVTPPSPPQQEAKVAEPAPLAPQPRRPVEDGRPNASLAVDEFGQNTNRLSMSLRPLPPDDPNDNPEQRANRIRSFYKEYFDDSKPEPASGNIYNDYYEDYGSEYLDGAIFDPQSGAFVVTQPNAPFAEPVTRRAMTPPPRAPPRFRSNTGPRGPHMSGSSAASSRQFLPPRGMSSMSGRLPQPMRPRAPPAPLASLPTPAKLTEDAMMINPADFAPPVSFRERQNGMRPDSPLGTPRPYSPAVRPHTPLASSYDDLMVMPSPHALRKSGLFTALDFAPPARIRDPGSNASDAGSIRSNRSGMSHAGRMAIRNGANRVSKIPADIVGTRDDIMSSLRPRMALTTPA